MNYEDSLKGWKQIKGQEHGNILEKANSMHEHNFFKKTALIKSSKLPFYKKSELVTVTEPTLTPAVKMRFIKCQDDLLKLDGTSSSIFEAIEKDEFSLDSNNVIKNYLCFYFSYVKGQEGSFCIVEDVEQINFSEEVPEDLYSNLETFISDIEVSDNAKDKKEVKFNMIYADCIYKAVANILDDGEIDIISEEARYSQLPIREIRLR